MIKNTLPNKSGNHESLKIFSLQLESSSTYSRRGFAEEILQFVLLTVLCFKWSVKRHCVSKILQGIWEKFLYQNNQNYNSYKFRYKFTFIPFLSFHRNLKQKSNIQQVGGLVTRNCFLFIASRALLQRHAQFNRLL